MIPILKVLIAEDNPDDAALLLRELRRAGFETEWKRVDTEAEYLKRLNGSLDLIISDYAMPQFDGLRALELLKASGHDVPFIIVSGMIGEDTAVAAMKLGAADYLLKDRLTRLGQAVRHALHQCRLRREREQTLKALRESEEKLRNIFDGISAFVGLFSTDGRVIDLNQAALQTIAICREDIVGRLFVEAPWWSHSAEVRQRISSALSLATQGSSVREELVAEVLEGRFIVVEVTFSPLRNAFGRVIKIVVSGVDISKRKEAEEKIQEQLDELLRWQDVMLHREDRVFSLKAEVNDLLTSQLRPARYSTPSL